MPTDYIVLYQPARLNCAILYLTRKLVVPTRVLIKKTCVELKPEVSTSAIRQVNSMLKFSRSGQAPSDLLP